MKTNLTHNQRMECVNAAIKERREVEPKAFMDVTDLSLINLIIAYWFYKSSMENE